MKKFWILVLVKGGFIQEPEFFLNIEAAMNRKEELLSDFFNRDYDEIDIFEKEIVLT